MKMLTTATILIVSLTTVSVQAASNTWSGTVNSISQNGPTSGANPQNVGYVSLVGTYTGAHPSCATVTSILSFDPTTVGGQNAFRALMAAKLAGSTVTLATTGACAIGGIVEDVLQFQF